MNMTGELFRKLEDIDPKVRDVLLSVMDEVEAKTRIITVGRGDFDELKNIVQSLAEAQDRTEKRMGELAQAQEQTEKRMGELAKAQEQTEKAVKALAAGLTDLRKQVGKLSMAVGYGIEDKLMPHARRFASTEFGMEVKLVDRRNLMYPDGGYDEVNLYVEGEREGRKAYLIGNARPNRERRISRISQNALNEYARILGTRSSAFWWGIIFPRKWKPTHGIAIRKSGGTEPSKWRAFHREPCRTKGIP